MATQRFINLNAGRLTEVVPATVSSGASSAGQIVALNSAGSIDTTMLPSGVGANAITVTASAAISAGSLVNIYSNAGVLNARPADSTSVGSKADGFAPSAIASGASGTVNLGPGSITGLASLTIGSDYYLGTVGGITATAPSTAGNIVQYVGKAVSATELDFQPAPMPVTVA